MATVPSLGEITSIRGDADLAYGTSGVGGNDTVVPLNRAVEFISLAAREKAQADQWKYLQFQKNQEDFFKGFGAVKTNGIMEADYPEIMEEYATLANDIASNLDVIRNPMKDQAKYAELKSREARLLTRIEQSKQNVASLQFNKEYMRLHPEMNTDDNNKVVNEYQKLKLGERGPLSLNTPMVYDPAARAKVANSVAQRKLKEEQAQGRYLKLEEATVYIQDEYDKAWDAMGAQTDKSGRSVYALAEDVYKRLPQEVTGGDFKAFDRNVGRSLMNQDETAITIKEDPVSAQEDQQAHERDLAAQRHRYDMAEIQKTYDLQKRNQDAKKAIAAGDKELLLTVTSKAFREKTGQFYQYYDQTNRKQAQGEIVPMEAYEKAGMSRQIMEDGKMVMQAPRLVIRDEQGMLRPVYDDLDKGGTHRVLGDAFTPEKFMRSFANNYFPEKEVSTLLESAKNTFRETTGVGTVDNFEAQDKWLSSGNRRSNFTEPGQRQTQMTPEQRDAGSLSDAAFFAKYGKAKPKK